MTTWIYLAYQLIRRALNNAALWSWIEEQVAEAAATDSLSGPEKRLWVAERLADIPPAQRQSLASVSEWLVNLAIETMVARLKTSGAA